MLKAEISTRKHSACLKQPRGRPRLLQLSIELVDCAGQACFAPAPKWQRGDSVHAQFAPLARPVERCSSPSVPGNSRRYLPGRLSRVLPLKLRAWSVAIEMGRSLSITTTRLRETPSRVE